jgi:hypothetical protein
MTDQAQTFVKGDRSRVVTTAAERVAAEWEGFVPQAEDAPAVDESTVENAGPTPELPVEPLPVSVSEPEVPDSSEIPVEAKPAKTKGPKPAPPKSSTSS